MGKIDEELLNERVVQINKLLRNIRKEKSITQRQIADETYLSKQMVSKMESENGNPTLRSLIQYCNSIGIDLWSAIYRNWLGDDGYIAELEQDIDEWIRIFAVLNDRENRHKWLDYWREKEGKSDLWYPDGDQVYKDFWEQKNRADMLERENAELKHKMSYMKNPFALGDRNNEMGW